MRKFIPRIINIVAFLIALFIFIPWSSLVYLFDLVGTKFSFMKGVCDNLINFFQTKEWIKAFYLISIEALISIVYFIVACIDRNKKHNMLISKPIANNIYEPLIYTSFALSIIGCISMLVNDVSFVISNSDILGLGKFLRMIPFFETLSLSSTIGSLIFLGLALVIILLGISLTKTHKRGFVARLLLYFLFAILSVLSIKGLNVAFQGVEYNTLDAMKEVPLSFYSFEGVDRYIILICSGLALILYILFAISRAHKNNVLMKESQTIVPDLKKAKKSSVPEQNEVLFPTQKQTQPVPADAIQNDPLFDLPAPEEVVETMIEEKTVVKQVIYEQPDLNQIFNTDFGFKNLTMVRKEGSKEYFVNKQKFLEISNSEKTVSFRLQLDKAIRLIIQYPLIGKDKYENHKIWFKIDDISVLNNETAVSIIKDAYTTVLNNE